MSRMMGLHPRSPHLRIAVAAVILVCLLAVVLALAGCGADPRMGRAAAFEDEGNIPAANELYQEILRERPNDVNALRALSVNYSLGGAFERAARLQELVVRLDTGDVETRVELAFNYLNHLGRAKRSVELLREAVDLAPSPKHRTFLAQALGQTGAESEAESELKAVIEDDPEYLYAYTVLARLLREQGRLDEAAQIESLREQQNTGLDGT